MNYKPFSSSPWQDALLLMGIIFLIGSVVIYKPTLASPPKNQSSPSEAQAGSFMVYLPLMLNNSDGSGSSPTITPSVTATSDSQIPTSTSSPTLTTTPTATATNDSQTFTPTPTSSTTATATMTPTPEFSATPTATMIVTPTSTNTETPMATETVTETPTYTPTSINTETPTATETVTETPTYTPTSTNTETPTATKTVTETPTYTPTMTNTPRPTATISNFSNYMIGDRLTDPQGVTVVDIDEDNDLDVVAAFGNEDYYLPQTINDGETDTIRLFLNGGDSNGNGAGGNWLEVAITDTFSIVAMQTTVADFDSDNDLDIAAVSLFDKETCGHPLSSCSPGKVMWFRNPGDVTGNWETNVISDTVWGARYIDAADLTGDGRPDLVVSTVSMPKNTQLQPDGLYWFRNENNATSWTGIEIDMTLEKVETVLAVDVDGDMITDVIASGKDSNKIAWYKNQTTPNDNPTFTKGIIASPTSPDHFTVANMDGDPHFEVIVTSDDGTNWYDLQGNSWTEHFITDLFKGVETRKVIYAADLDFDNDVDVAMVTGGPAIISTINLYLNNGNNWSWNGPPDTTSIPYSYVTGGDMNGDQQQDFVTAINDYIIPSLGEPGDNISWWIYEP